MTSKHNKDQIILDIAKRWFDVETLETRGLDQLDFYDVSVFCIKKALQEAYTEGSKQNKK